MKNRLFASIPAIVFGVLIAVAPISFAKVCASANGMHMACYYTGRAALGIGVVIAILGVVALFVKAPLRAGLSIAVIVNALLAIAVPTFLIGVCKSPMMHCASTTRPTLVVLGVLAAVFAAVAVYLDLKKEAE